MTEPTDTLSGEAQLKSRRNRFLRFCGLGFVIALATGFFTGIAGDLFREGTVPGSILYAAWAIAVAWFCWFSWEYFRRVDELDLLDNLWCSLVGLYVYAIALPSWWLFHDLGLAPEIDHAAIYFATLGAAGVAYALRKLGLR